VCDEVLPTIRKTGQYISPEKAADNLHAATIKVPGAGCRLRYHRRLWSCARQGWLRRQRLRLTALRRFRLRRRWPRRFRPSVLDQSSRRSSLQRSVPARAVRALPRGLVRAVPLLLGQG
jgi:hypothetical protein